MQSKAGPLIEALRKKLVDGKNVILLDVYTNGDIDKDPPPLSHAQLLRNYVLTDTVWPSGPPCAPKRVTPVRAPRRATKTPTEGGSAKKRKLE